MYLTMLGNIRDIKTFMEDIMSQMQVKSNHRQLNK